MGADETSDHGHFGRRHRRYRRYRLARIRCSVVRWISFDLIEFLVFFSFWFWLSVVVQSSGQPCDFLLFFFLFSLLLRRNPFEWETPEEYLSSRWPCCWFVVPVWSHVALLYFLFVVVVAAAGSSFSMGRWCGGSSVRRCASPHHYRLLPHKQGGGFPPLSLSSFVSLFLFLSLSSSLSILSVV